jgi:hypothetical protein
MRDEIQFLHATTRIDRIMQGKKTNSKPVAGNKVPVSVNLYQWICNTCWKIYRTEADAVRCARTHGLSVNGLSLIEHDKCQVCSSTFRINYFDSIMSNLCYYCSYMIVGLLLDDEFCKINEGIPERSKSEVQKEC